MNQQEQMIQSMSRMMTTAANASRKTVNIEIEESRMVKMRGAHYKLCFAKKVGDFEYNVVWQSFDDEEYSAYNEFSWEPRYEIFGTNTYEHSIRVKASTKTKPIGLGQICTLDKVGVLSNAVDGGNDHALNLKNDWKDIHVGINQISTDAAGKMVSSPIYVSESIAVLGQVELTPKERVLVWFQQDIETSTIFTSARSTAQEVDLTDTNGAKLLYNAKGEWKVV